MAASVQLSPSCWAHILQHSQPSVIRLTPSGQRGGDCGHSHGHLQNSGRVVVSSSGAGVKVIVVGVGERAVARMLPTLRTATAASVQGRSHLMPGSQRHRSYGSAQRMRMPLQGAGPRLGWPIRAAESLPQPPGAFVKATSDVRPTD